MTPAAVLRIWFFGFLGIALIAVGGWLIWDWYRGDPNREQLWWGVGLLALAFAGRLLLLPLGGLGWFKTPPETSATAAETRRIERPDGSELFVQILGRDGGPTIVLTHGWSMSSRVWCYARKELGSQYRLILWDLPGLGRSRGPTTADYSLEKMASDLGEVVRLAGPGPVVLLGHSIGGMIQLVFARLFRELLGRQVTGMVFVDTTYVNPLETMRLASIIRPLQKALIEPLLHLTVWLSPLVRWMNWQSYLNGSTHTSTRLTSFAGRQTADQVELVARLASFASPAVAARGALAMLKLDERSHLGAIDVPALVVAGYNDRVTTLDANRTLAATLPHGELVVLQPGGHQSVLEQHDNLAASVTQFVDRLGVVPRAIAS